MKITSPIAIHHRKDSFSERWIEFCKFHNTPFKIVNCHSTDIINHLADCSALMWHWHHANTEDKLIAPSIIKSAELMGIKIFPNYQTCWYFDNKIAQKYYMEALGIPHPKTYIFVERKQALSWVEKVTFPKVFKLSNGAGSSNVFLVKNKNSARRAIEKAFSSGYAAHNRFHDIQERWWQFKRDRTFLSFFTISRGLARMLIKHKALGKLPIEKNYAYFQELIPDNDSDIRVIVIGDRAFAIKRMVRDGDFRASGSGVINYNPDAIPKECIRMAFEIAKKANSQSIALDFVFFDGEPLVVEMSYAFMASGYRQCQGYWNSDLEWNQGAFRPEDFMIEDMLRTLF